VRNAGKPIDGVRVLDLTRLLPGAYATLLLADLGADVVKIEDPRGGDGMRTLPAAAGRGSYFERLNRDKRSVTLDLRAPGAAAVLDALADRADVIVESFRPSTARRLGVDGASLLRRHPRLVCASISGFGRSGQDAERAAHDINYQALAGLLRPPDLPGPLVGDIGAAMGAAIAILAALFARERTGAGSIVDAPIQDAANAWALFPTTAELASACYTLYETADGLWLALGALEPKFWRGFCDRIGRADLAPLQYARGADAARVADEVRRVMKTRTRSEWLAHFADADVCLAPVLTPAEAAAANSGVKPQAASEDDVRLKHDDTHVARPAPALGADTDAVLEESGISAAERLRLRADGVI
jgi:crotonobetainyl-CoA:carnitine CoA-transferase CaiB-like acyl-CoA transferase